TPTRTVTPSAPAELLLTVSWPPGTLAGTRGPETNDTLALELELEVDANTLADVTVVVAPPLEDW
ncbi:MAG: hypothetical protein OEN48_01015, partial [Betaproteobacteria bacterium]|nr:hypothetical protein [Betaproteobacteria bacterium]